MVKCILHGCLQYFDIVDHHIGAAANTQYKEHNQGNHKCRDGSPQHMLNMVKQIVAGDRGGEVGGFG